MMPACRTLVSLADCLDHHAVCRGDEEALVEGSQRLSWRQLQEAVNEFSEALVSLCMAPGQRLAFMGAPGMQFWVSLLACQRAGIVWVGLNPQYSVRELEHVLRDAAPVVALAAAGLSDIALSSLHQASAAAGTGQVLQLPAAPEFIPTLPALQRADERKTDAFATDLASAGIGLIVYTSGTTGASKGALITRGGLVENGWWLARRLDFQPLRTLVNLPINHIGCVGDVCATALVTGGTLVCMHRFDPGIAVRIIREQKIGWLPQVPAQFQLMLDRGGLGRDDLASVRCITWGGAPMSRQLIETLSRWVPDLFNSYGLSECTGTISMSARGSSLEVMANTVGEPVSPGCVRIADEQGEPLPAGCAGEIQIRGRHVFHGYLNNEEASREAFTDDGWLRTGDVGEFDQSGNIRLLGRTREMYKSGGYNVYPREIETVIESLDAVDICAVVSIPDPLWTEVGVAFVQCEAGSVSEAVILAHCSELLARYKLPKRVMLREELPLLPVGKVDKTRLRTEALALVASGPEGEK